MSSVASSHRTSWLGERGEHDVLTPPTPTPMRSPTGGFPHSTHFLLATSGALPWALEYKDENSPTNQEEFGVIQKRQIYKQTTLVLIPQQTQHLVYAQVCTGGATNSITLLIRKDPVEEFRLG